MQKRRSAPTAEEAETMALAGLGFLAEDSARLSRFLAMTGIEPDQLRTVAGAPETLLAVLDYLLGDESLLLVFAASKGFAPETVEPTRHALARSLGIETHM